MSLLTTAGPTRIGERYTVERQLGYGATATVYLCRDEHTGGLVAVKVLRPELAESVGAERFLREIRLTSDLDHPNIVPVIDSGAEGSMLYCVLPYLEGGTLRDVLRESKQLAIPHAVQIGSTIAEALAYAHAKGLIHRDIKPENILFGNGRAYLGDFGIARVLHATGGDMATTTTGVVRGTPAYMSPEQASGERNYDGRSDIYSLGCVVYEMVSGMPPFIGPTAQSVLAQRFSTTPRPMGTYRNTVSAELEQVIAKAMATAPADRFATAGELREALERAGRSVGGSVRSGSRARRLAMIGAAAGLVLAAGLFARQQGYFGGAPRQLADTTQLAVLPFERDPGTDALGSVDAFVYDAFSAWRGLTVLEPFLVRDAVSRNQSISGAERDHAVAISLGAGRFVRGSVTRLPGGDGWKVFAWLHQVSGRKDTTLFSHSITIRQVDLASIDVAYATLARTLLLRGQDSAGTSAVVTTTSLPAMQFFARGIDAVDEWDFAAADTFFQRAVETDPEYRRAYLWQAQIRFWQHAAPVLWAPLVQKALTDTMRLPTRDRQLAFALGALGGREFEQACERYDALRDRNDSDFAAWFGRGRCRDLDFRIVRDPQSPTGWRYRASYHEAVQSYRRAFEILSLSHRSLERAEFAPLRDLLYMRPSQLQGAIPPPEDSAQRFVGRLDMAGDTLVMRPIPQALVFAGDPAAVPARMREAIESQRGLFRQIAGSWSTALPSSAVAKEAVAVALEMAGNRAALDTLRVARRLARDPDLQLRLAVSEVIARLKFLDPADSVAARAIRNSADSIVGALGRASPSQLANVLPLLVLTGQCGVASDALARNPVSTHRGVSRDVVGAADGLSLRLMMGCAPASPSAEITRLQRSIETAPDAPPGTVQSLLSRAVQLTEGRDSALTSRFATLTGFYLLRAQAAAARGARDSVRAILRRVEDARERTGYDDIAPDAVVLESRVHLAIGDTAAVIASLDRLFSRLPYLTPGMLKRPVAMAGLLEAMTLRGTVGGGSAAAWGNVRRHFSR